MSFTKIYIENILSDWNLFIIAVLILLISIFAAWLFEFRNTREYRNSLIYLLIIKIIL